MTVMIKNAMIAQAGFGRLRMANDDRYKHLPLPRIKKIGGGGMGVCTKPRTSSLAGMSRSNFCRITLPTIARRWSVSGARRVPRQP